MENNQIKNKKNKSYSINLPQSVNPSLVYISRNVITHITLLFIYLFVSTTSSANVEKLFPVMWNVQNSNEHFVGREQFLKDMHEFLFKKQDFLVIAGSIGSGKAKIMKQYAELNKENYDIVWWIDVNKSLEEQYINFAKRWNKVISKYYKDSADQNFLQINLDLTEAKNVIEQVHDKLRITKLNWLIIFDNVKESFNMQTNMPKKHSDTGYGHIMISTNDITQNNNVMRLKKFSRDESIELLLKTTGEKDSHKANLLAHTLKDYPLAVAGAGSFIASYASINIEEYNQLFLTRRQELWKMEKQFRQKNSEDNNYQETISTTISLIINEVKKESSLAYDLMAISAFLDNENIPEALLLQYVITNYDQDYLENNHSDQMKDNQKSIDLEFKNALSILLKYSLLMKNYSQEKAGANLKKELLFTTHEFSQLVMQDLLNEKDKKLYLNKAIDAINKCLPSNIYRLTNFLSESFYFIPNITALIKYAEDFKLYNNEVILLELRALEYNLAGIRNDKEAERLIKKIEKTSKHVADQDVVQKIRFTIMKSAFLAWVKADYPASLKEALFANELIKESPDEHPEERLMIYNRLARLYNAMGNNVAALKYADLGKQIVKNAPNLLGYQNDFYKILVKLYVDSGDYNQALKYSELILTKIESQAKILPSDISTFLINADILIRMGKYQEAMQKLSILEQLSEDSLPSDNSYKTNITTYNTYVGALLGKNLDQAIKFSIANQEVLKKSLGEISYYKSRPVFMSYKFLGEIYEKQGDNIKAEQEYSTGLKILTNIYGQSSHAVTDDLSDIYNKLAIINLKLKRSTKALEYLKLHRQVFGYKHPRSIKLIGSFVKNNIDPWF